MRTNQHVNLYRLCSLLRSIQLTASEKETFFGNLDSRRQEFQAELNFANVLIEVGMKHFGFEK